MIGFICTVHLQQAPTPAQAGLCYRRQYLVQMTIVGTRVRKTDALEISTLIDLIVILHH